MTLIIDCCLSGKDSATRKLYEAYLKKIGKDDIKIVYLEDEDLKPYTIKDIALREEHLANGDLDWEEFKYANDFREADEVIVAAPYWDLSFPSLLKVYVEHIMVPGITFNYVEDRPVGESKANKLIYFTTVGGFLNNKDFGTEYVKNIAEMLGIPEFETYAIKGLDIDPTKRDLLIDEGINRILNKIDSK